MYWKVSGDDSTWYYSTAGTDHAEDLVNNLELLVAEAEQNEDKTWFKFKFHSGDDESEYWIPTDKVEQTTPPEPLPLEGKYLWAYVKNATVTARQVNEEDGDTGYGISRDFLLAYASLLSGTTNNRTPRNLNKKFQGTDYIGPLQLTNAKWEEFVSSPANKDGFVANDINDPVLQMYGFGHLVCEKTEELSKRLSTLDTEGADGPYIPSHIELLMAVTLGVDTAVDLIEAIKTSPDTDSIELINAHADDLGKQFVSKYKHFFHDGSNSLTAKNALKKMEEYLTKALINAQALVEEHTPEDVFRPQGGAFPWMGLAEDELIKGVKETGTPPNPQILEYFEATDHDPQNKEEAWCGAFVAWCIANCGNDIAKKSVESPKFKGQARAANWRTWGDFSIPQGSMKADSFPQGAVVLLTPSSPSNSGHVGFLKSINKSKVTLLGGNQSDSVKESAYDRTRIVEIRMLQGLDPAFSTTSGPGTNIGSGATLGPFDTNDWEKYMTVLSNRESNHNYKAENRYGYIGRWQFGALALIDCGFVKAGTSQSSLHKASRWTGKHGASSQQKWFANTNGCQDKAIHILTSINYKRLKNSGGIKTGDSKAVVAGMLAASHLLGAGGANKMRKGNDSVDGNNVSGSAYFKMLSQAFGGPANVPS